MSFSTTAPEPKEVNRQRRLEEIRDYHQDLINDLGIQRGDFNMKSVLYDRQNRLVVGIFASEFRKDKGFYFEIIDRHTLEPADRLRKVYRIPNNPHFEHEYEVNDKGSYLVPIEELRVVNPTSVAISGPSAVVEKPSLKNPIPTYRPTPEGSGEDAPYSDMTIRDYFAIHTGKPVSTRHWLNDLIKSNT